MGVPARTNEYGDFNFREGFVVTTKTTRVNGTVTTSQSANSQGVHSCNRAGHSKNKPAKFGTYVTGWKKPSSYERHAVDYESKSGVWRDTSFTGTSPTSISEKEVEGWPSNGSSWRMLDCPPLWEGGTKAQWLTDQIDRVTMEAMSKIADNKAELGAAIAEARQTGEMLATRGVQLYNALRDVKHGRWAKLRREGFGIKNRIKNGEPIVSNAILEYNFGWKPLMGDIYGVHELLKQNLTNLPMVHGFKFAHETFDAKPSGTKWTSQGSADGIFGCELWGYLDDNTARLVNQAGLSNPASVIWEVVPWSFVVDWFIPVGNTLNALTAANGLKFAGGYQSVRMEANVTATLKPTGNYEEVSPRTIEATAFSYRRKKLTAWPRPVFYAKSPFSSSHILNAAALLGQRIR